MAEPKIHVLRADLPWRNEDQKTECGLDVDGHDVLTRDEVRKKADEWGERRTMLLLCMTCNDTSGRWSTWEEDPATVMLRSCHRGEGRFGVPSDRGLLNRELRVLAMLVGAHRDEFDAAMAGLEEATDLHDRRVSKRARRAWPCSG